MEVYVESWCELQEALFADSWNPELSRFRSRYAFRGIPNKCFPLTTSLMRLGGPYEQLEKHLLRNFRKYAHGNVVEKDSFFHWVSVANHYGLPTRLLDWTYSPFIALHFATVDLEHYNEDAALWALNYVSVHALAPQPLKNILIEEGANVFTIEMLEKAVENFEGLKSLQDTPYFLFFEPPSIDARILNQCALFSLPSTANLLLDDWLNQHLGVWKKIIIPAKLKWEIRDKLDQANICERILFPGLDGLSRFLKRQYSPAQPLPSETNI